MFEKFDHSVYRKRLEDLCTRLEKANLRVDSTRLDSYRKTFAQMEKIVSEGRVRQLPDEMNFETLLNDFEESQEIIEACDQFSDLTLPGVRDRLEKVLSGSRELAKETAVKGEPRNVLFELVMAARIKRAGFEVDLSRIEDVFFALFNRPCFVECKRVHSPRKLKTRIDEAARQIGRRCDDSKSSKARGIVALDVSKMENTGSVLLPCQSDDQVALEVKHTLECFLALHKSTLESVRERRVLGLYVYLHLPAAILQPIGFRVGKSAVIKTLHGPKTKDGELALKFLERIQKSETP